MDRAAVEEEEQSAEQPKVLTEGRAKILLERRNVFYNPVQQFNRDLSIAVLTEYSSERSGGECATTTTTGKKSGEDSTASGLRILEALSATGLRSIRYAKEVPGVGAIVANDISAQAVEAIRRNVAFNEVEGLVQPHNDDATMVMYQNRRTKFDVVDLDPYGCPSTFLDAAVQCLKDHGLLLVTATDMAVLAGNSPETCYVKYGAVSLKSKSCHEMALRILLQHIASHAARYGKVIAPVLSISADFYIRVFVKLRTSQVACKQNTSNLGLVYQCLGCESMTIQPLGTTNEKNAHKLPPAPAVDKLCSFCRHKHHMGGPIWTGPLHDKAFVRRILDAIESEEEDSHLKQLACVRRIQGILHVVHEELECPLYYQLDRLTSVVKLQVPPMIRFRSALLNAGYRVSYSHAHKTSVKTDAPNHVIWDIVRALEKERPIKRDKFEASSAGLAILGGESVTRVSFQKHPDAVPFSQRQKLTRFQLNPSAHWGPGTRSTTIIQEQRTRLPSKQERNQNKHKKRMREREEEEAAATAAAAVAAAADGEGDEKKRKVDDESPA